MDQQSVAPDSRSVVGDQLRAVRRRWRLVALVATLAVAASLAYSLLRVPEYRSTADVLLSATAYDVQRGGAELTSEEMATQVQVATSRPVANLVRDDLRLAATPSLDDHVTVEALGSSRVLRFTARTSHPEEAAEIVGDAAAQGEKVQFLVQGTLYPDVVESGGGTGTANIKSHHNVGGLPEDLEFELVEPLRTLFKDEVRLVGEQLGLPAEISTRPAAYLDARPALLAHEERHSWQYVFCLGLPMLPLYALGAAWSYLRGGDLGVHNPFERLAGLADGGYPLVSARERRRPTG